MYYFFFQNSSVKKFLNTEKKILYKFGGFLFRWDIYLVPSFSPIEKNKEYERIVASFGNNRFSCTTFTNFLRYILSLPCNIAATSVALLSKITELRDRFVSILSTLGTWDRYFIIVNLRPSALMGGGQRDNRGILIIRETHLVKINERRNARRHVE